MGLYPTNVLTGRFVTGRLTGVLTFPGGGTLHLTPRSTPEMCLLTSVTVVFYYILFCTNVLLLCCVTCMTGLRLTFYSLEDVVKFLLNHGFEYVLTSKFSQDPLEEHFGRRRQSARRSANPSLQTLGVQENKFRIQRTVATSITPKGNTRGSKRPKEGITVTTSPLKRRKKSSY